MCKYRCKAEGGGGGPPRTRRTARGARERRDTSAAARKVGVLKEWVRAGGCIEGGVELSQVLALARAPLARSSGEGDGKMIRRERAFAVHFRRAMNIECI